MGHHNGNAPVTTKAARRRRTTPMSRLSLRQGLSRSVACVRASELPCCIVIRSQQALLAEQKSAVENRVCRKQTPVPDSPVRRGGHVSLRPFQAILAWLLGSGPTQNFGAIRNFIGVLHLSHSQLPESACGRVGKQVADYSRSPRPTHLNAACLDALATSSCCSSVQKK